MSKKLQRQRISWGFNLSPLLSPQRQSSVVSYARGNQRGFHLLPVGFPRLRGTHAEI